MNCANHKSRNGNGGWKQEKKIHDGNDAVKNTNFQILSVYSYFSSHQKFFCVALKRLPIFQALCKIMGRKSMVLSLGIVYIAMHTVYSVV